MIVEECRNLFTDTALGFEYEKAVLLNFFSKLCLKMDNDKAYRTHILSLYRESFNKSQTTKIILQKEFDFIISDLQSTSFSLWIDAYFKKDGRRRSFTEKYKLELSRLQNDICPICHQHLGSNLSFIHIDHIIPWKLVGDELDSNYQCLCDSCNKKKSASVDYIFNSMINLA